MRSTVVFECGHLLYLSVDNCCIEIPTNSGAPIGLNISGTVKLTPNQILRTLTKVVLAGFSLVLCRFIYVETSPVANIEFVGDTTIACLVLQVTEFHSNVQLKLEADLKQPHPSHLSEVFKCVSIPQFGADSRVSNTHKCDFNYSFKRRVVSQLWTGWQSLPTLSHSLRLVSILKSRLFWNFKNQGRFGSFQVVNLLQLSEGGLSPVHLCCQASGPETRHLRFLLSHLGSGQYREFAEC